MAKVSILMNCYNCEKYLKEAIDSIYAQTYTDWEIIFVDNCSTDGSIDIAKSYDKKLKIYKTQKNIPLGAARNFGLQFCKGKYLAFLDTDDIWLPNKLEIQINLMENQNKSISFTSAYYINSKGLIIGKMLLNDKDKLFCHQLIDYKINMQSVVINQLKISEQIRFDNNLKYAPDYNLFMYILGKYQEDSIIIKDILVHYRIHNDSLSKDTSLYRQYEENKISLYFFKEVGLVDNLKCNDSYMNALLLNEERLAEYYLSKKNYFQASKLFLKLTKLNIKFFIKGMIFMIPLLNNIFYAFLMKNREKKLCVE